MKIALVTRMFLPKWPAGAEIAAYNIAKGLAERGHDVHVVTSMDKGLPQETIEAGFHIYRLKYPRIGLLSTAFFSLAVLNTLRRIKPDLVHTQVAYYGIAGYLLKRLEKKPYIVYFRGGDLYLPYPGTRPLLRVIVKNAEVVLTLTEQMRSVVQRDYGRDALAIPNGVDPDRFANLDRGKARAKLKIGEDEEVVLYVGRFHTIKGLGYLIEAMRTVSQTNPKARLVLVGYGEERAKLETLASKLNLRKYITFIGKVPNEKIPEYMIASDIFVFPTLWESFGIVTIEAMAAGLPVIASNVGVAAEIVNNGENGFLVTPGSPEELAAKIVLLLADDKLRDMMSINNKIKAHQYRWDDIVAKIEEAYYKAMEQPQ